MFNIRKGLVKSVLYDRKGRACSALKTDIIGLGLRLKNDRVAMLFRSFCKYPCGYFPVLDRGLILLTSVGSSSHIDNFRSWRKNNWPCSKRFCQFPIHRTLVYTSDLRYPNSEVLCKLVAACTWVSRTSSAALSTSFNRQPTANFIIVDKLHLLLTAIRDVYAVMREN